MKKHIVHKLFWDFEIEENWLNKMAAMGMNFIDYTFARYLFEQGIPGEYIYRIELLPELPSHPESQAYIQFMESVGAEYMGKWTRWVYFRKKAADGPFEIFSDYTSKIRHYQRVMILFGILGSINLVAFLYNLIFGMIARTIYHNDYLSYFSPLVMINGLIAAILLVVVVRYAKKVRILKKEKLLHE